MKQLSMFDAMAENETKREIVVPKAADGERVYSIPEDVWRTRCKYCQHKNAEKNAAIPASVIYRYSYEKVIPCRILTVAQPNKMPGECMSFAPVHHLYGICETCVHDNMFAEGFCRKKDHAEKRRVYWGKSYNNDKPDYWGEHRLSVCDDYEPKAEDLVRPEEEAEANG